MWRSRPAGFCDDVYPLGKGGEAGRRGPALRDGKNAMRGVFSFPPVWVVFICQSCIIGLIYICRRGYGRDTVKAVRRHRIYVEDDMLSLSADLTAELEEKLVFSGGFETPVPVEAENASVRFISLSCAYLFGVVTAAADMDAAMAVLDAARASRWRAAASRCCASPIL